jgi:hypothetical protein
MKIDKDTEHFSLADYRDADFYNENDRGITISAGNGDGLYAMDEAELHELRDLVDWAIALLALEKKMKVD